jgi:cation-transporting P-type ATPase E
MTPGSATPSMAAGMTSSERAFGPPHAVDAGHGGLGLSAREAAVRRSTGQGNDYRPPSSRTYWEIFRDNSYPFINGPLLVVTTLLIASGAFVEAALTGIPVIGNIAIGVVQGSRAKRQLDQVALLTRPTARVLRDGQERELPAREIVAGDVIVVGRGDEVQVDGRVLEVAELSVDESALTGESDAIEKRPGDRLLSGSAVLAGTALYEADAVGAATFANRLLAKAKGRRDAQTPLQRDIARAFVAVAVLIAVSSVLVAVSMLTRSADATRDAILVAAVLVTLVPQGLALMLTVTYTAAAVRISRMGALAQRQSVVEAISRVDTFCTDKTGTLTTQKIQFRTLHLVDGVADEAAVGELLATVAASTSAPNRTTAALADAFPGDAQPITEEIAFSSALRWSAIRLAGSGETLVLGASAVLGPQLEGGAAVLEHAGRLSSNGHRVLVFARGSTDAVLRTDAGPAIPGPLTALAILTFEEEIRPEARATIEGLRRNGVDVKIVSGDDPATVAAIGASLGLPLDGGAASGLELAQLDDDALATAAERTTIFGRVDPELKARLVTGLKARGRYVAMTGDGVNDILPVRMADVGVAMHSGSPATRGVADLVLVRDDFSIVPEAIRDGQRIVAAMAATLTVLLARTFYILLIIVVASLVQLPFPFTPRQNSIIAFVTVGVPILVLALWVRPAPSRAGLLGRTLRISIPLSLGVAAVALPIYAVALASGVSVEVARTMLTTISCLMGIGALALVPVACTREGRLTIPGWVRTLGLVAVMAAAYLGVLATSLGRGFYELEPLPWQVVAILGFIAAAWTIAVLLVHHTLIVQRGIDRLLVAWSTVRR